MSAPGIPVLDLATATAAELLAGLQSSSCVFLTGVPALGEPLRQLLVAVREFYALPAGEKDRVRWDGVGPWVGWQPLYEGEGPRALPLERYEFALPAPGDFPTTLPGPRLSASGRPNRPGSPWP